ncbi:hypothetical protein, partial [Falsiroseomonas sp. E2-1-a4]|uniref:hypothetical protein n=1 Tax=Falsiroseomonas sp. E2-1-a4 TaxID=3239299 RepID=UPI003F405C20
MTSRYGLDIRAATAADAPGVATLLAEAGHVVTPSELAERLAALREASGTVLLAVQWGPPNGVLCPASAPLGQMSGVEERRI